MKYFTSRLIAGILDSVVFSAFSLWYMYQFGEIGENGLPELHGFSHLFILFSVWFIYFPLPEGLSGYTLFKYMFDVKVVSLIGNEVSILQSFKRHLFDPVDYFFGIGVFIAYNSSKHQRIGDIIAKTKVISDVPDIEQTEIRNNTEPVQVNEITQMISKPFLFQRIIAFIIDYTVWFLVVLGIVTLFGTVGESGNKNINGLPGLLTMFGSWLIVIVIPESYFGYTLGKGAFNLRVIADKPGRNSFILSFVRHLFDFIEVCLFFGLFSAILIKITDDHKRIADFIAGSKVIYDNRD